MKFSPKVKEVKQWIVEYQSDIILVIGVILISLLSFAAGYIFSKQQDKTPIKIEQQSYYEGSYNRGWDIRTVSRVEIG